MNVAGFEFPEDLHYQAEDQVWARLEGDGTATVGITAMGVAQAGGEIYWCRPKAVGQVVQQRHSLAVVELAKAIVSVKSPLGGEVLAVNEALQTEPERIHLAPFEGGWIARIRIADLAADMPALVHGEPVAAAMQHQAWLNRQAEDGVL